MTIAAANNLIVMTGNIGNAYLNANTQENIYTHAGIQFQFVGIMVEGTLLEVIKALYGLPTSGNRWHAHLLHTMKEIVFKPIRIDQDIWIIGRQGGQDYIRTHIDDVLVLACCFLLLIKFMSIMRHKVPLVYFR